LVLKLRAALDDSKFAKLVGAVIHEGGAEWPWFDH